MFLPAEFNPMFLYGVVNTSLSYHILVHIREATESRYIYLYAYSIICSS